MVPHLQAATVTGNSDCLGTRDDVLAYDENKGIPILKTRHVMCHVHDGVEQSSSFCLIDRVQNIYYAFSTTMFKHKATVPSSHMSSQLSYWIHENLQSQLRVQTL